VSGTIGDAGAGLACLKGGGQHLPAAARNGLIRRFHLPEPRTRLGPALVSLASASVDVSDGLLADLGHIAATSDVRLVVEAERVPLSPALTALWPEPRDRIMRATTSGDDYEIAFTSPASAREAVFAIAAGASVPVTEIGWVEAGEGVVLVDAEGHTIPIARGGYVHF
jgi:thiamine-monophosphate kinase